IVDRPRLSGERNRHENDENQDDASVHNGSLPTDARSTDINVCGLTHSLFLPPLGVEQQLVFIAGNFSTPKQAPKLVAECTMQRPGSLNLDSLFFDQTDELVQLLDLGGQRSPNIFERLPRFFQHRDGAVVDKTLINAAVYIRKFRTPAFQVLLSGRHKD